MNDITHPTQQDEALRRAQQDDTPSETCRRLLLDIAQYLQVARPTDVMAEASRVYLASSHAQRWYGQDTATGAAHTRQVLQHAPAPQPGQTRGEYALILRDVAGGGA
ncbi:hypothetical protein ACIGBH_27460 [Streptomyces sp. NPDC085929]|uniref:hypothetical protein n=1 Tax=Streptomyces sp. NPDC085929 TaxID=3365739 RepID=UPI0037CF1D7B